MAVSTTESTLSAIVAEERDRKAEHIALALEERMQVAGSPFDRWRLEHCALPELDWDDLDVSCEFLGKRLQAPLLISCMTGGTGAAERINRNLAIAAEARGIAIGVGSQRKALEDPETEASFKVRAAAPTVPVLANLGAVQLNYGYGVEECRRAVEMVGADALALHLNPLQEALQPEGQLRFGSLSPKIAAVVEALEVPVIVKEIGCGISERVGRTLARIGVRWVDTAGVGGTSWARIEAARADDLEIGELFAGWGLETPDSIRSLRRIAELEIIGSGGVRNGLDVAKTIALGARLAGMAYPFLKAADASPEAVIDKIDRTVRELKVAMFCAGVRNLAELSRLALVSEGGHER